MSEMFLIKALKGKKGRVLAKLRMENTRVKIACESKIVAQLSVSLQALILNKLNNFCRGTLSEIAKNHLNTNTRNNMETPDSKQKQMKLRIASQLCHKLNIRKTQYLKALARSSKDISHHCMGSVSCKVTLLRFPHSQKSYTSRRA